MISYITKAKIRPLIRDVIFSFAENAKALRASAQETGEDLEVKVGRFRSKLVHKVVISAAGSATIF